MDTLYTINELPAVDPSQLGDLASQTQQLFAQGAKAWQQRFQAITNLRCINKSVPHYVNQLFEMFGQQIIESIDDLKPKIQRNSLSLLNEVFTIGRAIQICPQVFQVFLPKLITKSQQAESKQIRDECLQTISNYVLQCSHYECGLYALVQLSVDQKKSLQVQKFVLQVIAKQLQTVGAYLQQFSTQTLSFMMQVFTHLLDKATAEVQTYTFQICMFLHSLVGDTNFKSWMSVALQPDQAQNMINRVQEVIKKKSKAKHTSMTDMKHRMTYGMYENQEQIEKVNHFKEFIQDKQNANNFLHMDQVQALQPQNENVNYQQMSNQQHYQYY